MPRLHMRFLGGYQVQLDEEPVVIALEYDKVRALLAYLALEADRAHRREALAGLLWPGFSEGRARRNLSQALSALRRALGEDVATSSLIVTPQTIQFDPASDHWIDVSRFTSLLAACRGHPHWRLETCAACGPRLERACALYRGAFLQGLSIADSPTFEEWQLLWRERLHHEATDALQALTAGCEHRGDDETALRYAERWVALDPWHEGAQRALLRALAQSGRRAEALSQYDTCRRTLDEELGVSPAQETVALVQAIRDGTALPARCPPLPHNLPPPTTPFVGREALLDELRSLLRDPGCRLVTLVGLGGSGKTRLALQAGAEVVAQAAYDRFPDGVWFVSLASLCAGESIAPPIVQALGYGLSPGVDPARGLLNALRRKRLLLILDNYEGLLDSGSPGRLCGAGAVVEVLHAAPGVEILVTSRARLNVLAEHVLPVGGMDVPAPEEGGEIARYSGVALFVERGRALRPSFAPQGDEWAHVGRICRLVGGMPLAILLAASWIDVLRPAEIADRLATNLNLLAADLDDLPARQRSMRAVFDASWSRLSLQARAAFARMSVFRGGFAEEAARAVAGARLDTLRELVRTCALQRAEGGRYEIHELLRQYGEARLAEEADERETYERHCAYYAAFYAERAERVWKTGLGPVAPEIENVRAAWRWAVERGRVTQVRAFLGRLIGGILQLYQSLDIDKEGQQTFAQAVEVFRAAERSTENDLALAIALRYHVLFGYDEVERREPSLRLIHESMAILCRLGAMDELALAEIVAALVLIRDDEAESERLLLDSLALARESGCEFGIGWASFLLGARAVRRQAYDEAQEYLDVSLRANRRIGHHRGLSWPISKLAELAYCRADYARAHVLAADSVAICEQISWTLRVVEQLLLCGEVALAQDAPDEARTHFEDARARAQHLGDDRLLTFALCGLGDAALAGRDLGRARSIYRQALEIAEEDGRDELRCRATVGLAMLERQEGHLQPAMALVARADRILRDPQPPIPDLLTASWMDVRIRTNRLHAELAEELGPS